MAQQGAALQSYNNELVKSIEALLQRRATLNKAIEAESLEKSRLEEQRRAVEERLTSVDSSLQTKLDQRAEYDKVIGEAEQVNLELNKTKYFRLRWYDSDFKCSLIAL